MRVRTPFTSTSASGELPEPRPPERSGEGPSRDFGRLLIGLIVVTLGVLFLLDTADVLRADRAIDRWWPLAIVAAGALTLAERPPARVRGLILTGAGVLLLLFTTDVLGDDAWNYVWPAALIVIGATIIARWSGRSMPKGAVDDDIMRSTAVFSGSEMVSAAPLFRGAWLTAIFGALVVLLVIAFYKELLVISFDPVLAAILRLPAQFFRYLLLVMLAVTIVIALQTVGVGLMVAMLITPAAAASLLTRRLPVMMATAALIGAVSGVIGLYLSYYVSVASGAAIVLVCTTFFLLALFFAPTRGIVWRYARNHQWVR